MIGAFKNLLGAKKSTLPGVTVNFHQTTIQDFRAGIRRSEADDGGERERYHFIHSVHSIYFAADDLQGSIRDLYESLVDNGILLIVTATGNIMHGYTKILI